MAVANTFTFGGVSTTTYSVIVEGAGDYSGAKRAVEMVSIPGRNGAFALDKGYFENEPVEYDVLIQGATQATFETAVSSFRNAILSKTGYQRLTDTYHPNEYRMAVYSGGFDEEPTFHGKGASFKVKFDCKPQRWLTSGETATAVASGGTVTNPTLFPSSPLLAVKGYGDIDINGGLISATSRAYGNIQVAASKVISNSDWLIITIDDALLNAGDNIVISGLKMKAEYVLNAGYVLRDFKLYNSLTTNASGYVNGLSATAEFEPLTLTYGTSFSDYNAHQHRLGLVMEYTYNGTDINQTNDLEVDFSYNGAAQITARLQFGSFNAATVKERQASVAPTIADSSKTIPFNPLYIDLDLGEAWTMDGGEVRDANSTVSLETVLPALVPGLNTITYDNTITELKVTPRWWKV